MADHKYIVCYVELSSLHAWWEMAEKLKKEEWIQDLSWKWQKTVLTIDRCQSQEIQIMKIVLTNRNATMHFMRVFLLSITLKTQQVVFQRRNPFLKKIKGSKLILFNRNNMTIFLNYRVRNTESQFILWQKQKNSHGKWGTSVWKTSRALTYSRRIKIAH